MQLRSLKEAAGLAEADPVGPQTPATLAVTSKPVEAKYVRSNWEYRMVISTPKGPASRWLPANRFSTAELQDARQLRQAFLDAATPKLRALMESRGVIA